MAAVEFRNVVKRFGDIEVIPDMNLTIEDGEFVALLGPSGCGKSTSLFMLAGIYLPSGGELLFDGRIVNEVEAKDRNVGIVFQSYALYPHMTVRDNILFPLRFKRVPREEALRRERERLRETGITHYEWAESANVLIAPVRGDVFFRSASGSVKKLAGGALDPHLSKDGSLVAFVRGGDLYALPTGGGPEGRPQGGCE